MARQDIDIGVEGNDNTGDSIRESFRKVNENFQEIYAIFGAGGTIQFTSLADTPDQLLPNTLPLVSSDASQINLVELASNSAIDPNDADTITFTYTQLGKLVISTAFTKLSDDQEPTLGGPLNVGGNAIGNVSISQAAVDTFNERHNENLTIDDLVITKGFADRRYISSGLPIRVAPEPANQDNFILEINRYINGNIEVPGHGYDTSINGIAFNFNSIYDDPNNLTSGTTYFLRFVSDSQLSVHTTRDDAQVVDQTDAEANKIFVSGAIESDDVHTMTDAGLDTSLEGNFLSDVAMPRDSVVRRQGDTMTGTLTLSDHPGDLSGFGIVNGADDLQAASKFYVDQSGYSSTVNLFVSTNGDDRMIGVPPGREGSALNYAYRTINAAAQRAFETVKTAPEEPGPYFQTITKDNGASPATVTVAGIDSPVYTQTRNLIQLNREYVQKEITGYLAYEYPDFIYEIDTCERDIGLILDAIAYDINRGLNANFLTRTAAERYYSSSSGRYAIGQQLTETVDSINTAKLIVESILQNKLYREKSIVTVNVDGDRARVVTSPDHGLTDREQVIFKDMGGMTEIEGQTAYVRVISDSVFELYEDPNLLTLWDISSYTPYTTGGRMGVVYQPRIADFDSVKIQQTFDEPDSETAAINAVNAKFDLVTNILQNGIEAGADDVFGSTYKLVLDNGAGSFIDQGDPDNTDTLPGKVIVGLNSGAKGRIVTLTNNDGTENNNDTFQLIQLNGVDFEVGEPVEYGNFVKTKQVTIFVESGIYEEDYPIRLANNVSLKGDEFRRVIIRPKRRTSQSTWANMYFFRDLEFDEIPLLDIKHSTITSTSASTDTFTVDDTSWMTVGDTVKFVGETLFGGVQRNTEYFVKEIVSSTEFKISETQGGADFALSDSAGVFYVSDSAVSPFVNQTNQVQGYFGRHYLTDPYRDVNVGVIPTNAGNFSSAADILRKNKTFLQDEIIFYINDNVTTANTAGATGSIWFGFTYDTDKVRKNIGTIVDGLIKDFDRGGSEFSLESQGVIFKTTLVSERTQIETAINQITSIAGQLLGGNAPTQNTDVQPDTSGGTGESGAIALLGNLISLITFGFDENYNPPLDNDADGVDVFMMSDATIVRNATVQGHGGFMVVLDPEGQILTKSPYIQTGSSFSKSDNVKKFRGGMYVDAFVGNIPARITNVVNPFQLEVESDTGQGLFIRPPELPCPFYLGGIRYQVNAIANYDSGQGTVTLFLDPGSGEGSGYSGSTPQEIFLQTAGNRSMLGNDFTQINDLGYGLVTNNGAFSEMVSMFTYYCQAAYYAKNGSEIRSLNGSNGYGNFGLVAEGADPNEIPDQVTLNRPMIQPAKAFTTEAFGNVFDDPSITVTDLKFEPTINSQITIDHGPEGQVRTVINIGAADVSRTAGTYTNVSATGGSGTGATFDVVVDGSGAATVTINNPGVDYILGETLTIADADLGGGGAANLTLEVGFASPGAGVLNYRISNVTNLSDADQDGTEGEPGDVLATGGVYSNSVYQLALRADDASPADFFGTLQDYVPADTYIEFRTDSTIIFDGVAVPERLETRPSTAINFDESDNTTYRSLAFSTQDSLAQPLGANQIIVDVDSGFNYAVLFTDPANLSGGYGSAQGDTSLAISPIADADAIARLLRDVTGKQPGDAGYAGGMIFAWEGKTHRITGYTDNSGSGGFAFIDFEDVADTDITGLGVTGLNQPFPAEERTFRAGLNTNATAEITIAISLLRATGHDFTQIGTGSFNDSNYPNVILGDPERDLAEPYTDAPTATSSQVWERRKGRVFFVTTDQFGFFRVGKFFSVDQATGDVEITGEIGLTNANSLGFKRGVTINEFSADDSFSDNSAQAVPTEKAIASYVNRVLGFNVTAGSQIAASPAGNRIGPGFLPLDGGSAMEDNMDMGSNQITNLDLPGTDGTAAANKNYVDGKANDYDQIEDLRNTEINNVTANDLIIATGYRRIYTTPTTGGNWSVGDSIGTTGGLKAATIIDLETTTDPILDNILIITYEITSGLDFVIGETLFDLPGETISATIEDGPVDEFANAEESTDSVINVTVDRSTGGKATYNLQLEDNSVVNADINSNAAIAQSKLNMQDAVTFDEDDATTGWSGTATKVQSDLGLATFSDNNFETVSGYVRIKANGVLFHELNQVDQYQVFGRNWENTGDIEAIDYSDVVKFGLGIEDKDFTTTWNDITTDAVTKLTLDRKVTVVAGQTISQPGSGASAEVRHSSETSNIVYVINVVNGPFDTISTTDFLELDGSALFEDNTFDEGATLNRVLPTNQDSVTTSGDALITIDSGDGGRVYARTQISTSGADNSIARRDAAGTLDASGYKLGAFDIINLASTTITYTTPGGATILSAVGNNSESLVVDVPGSIDVGSTTVTESNAQAGSSYAGEGFVASDWTYTNFIEATSEAGEQANQTTGIGLGAGNGYAGAASDTILFVAGGSVVATVTQDVDVANNLTVNGDLTVNGNFQFADANTDTFTIDGELIFGVDGRLGSNIIPDANNSRNIGASGTRFNTVYATLFDGTALTARYADLAENYQADAEYEPGTVLIFGGDEEVSTTNQKGDRRVAGVVSTNPAYLMNSELTGTNVVAVALQGRIPCKVLGKVQKGDILVTSAIPGYAVVNNDPKIGTIIGKALQNKETDGKDVIEIVVGRV